MESRAFVLFFFSWLNSTTIYIVGSYPAWWFVEPGHVNPGSSDVSGKGATFTQQQLGINSRIKLFFEWMDKSNQLGINPQVQLEKPPGCGSPEASTNPPGEVDERGELCIGSLTRGFLDMPVVLDSFEVVMR